MQEPNWPECLEAWEQLGCLVAQGVGVGVGRFLSWRPSTSIYTHIGPGCLGLRGQGAGREGPRTGEPHWVSFNPMVSHKVQFSPLPSGHGGAPGLRRHFYSYLWWGSAHEGCRSPGNTCQSRELGSVWVLE